MENSLGWPVRSVPLRPVIRIEKAVVRVRQRRRWGRTETSLRAIAGFARQKQLLCGANSIRHTFPSSAKQCEDTTAEGNNSG
jgi:hypothetical protein